MKVDRIFLSVNARDFAAMMDWYATLLDRQWDREPMPSCREWDLTAGALFQVLDNPDGAGGTAVSLHVAGLDAQIERLRSAGIAVPDPVRVEGFATLRYAAFADPEGNPIGLLEGA